MGQKLSNQNDYNLQINFQTFRYEILEIHMLHMLQKCMPE